MLPVVVVVVMAQLKDEDNFKVVVDNNVRVRLGFLFFLVVFNLRNKQNVCSLGYTEVVVVLRFCRLVFFC